MKNWAIFKPIIDLYHSFFNNDNGFSFRKIAAAYGFYVAAKLSFSITDQTYKFYSACAWISLGAVCIGLVTIPDLIKFLSDKTGRITETTTKETVKE